MTKTKNKTLDDLFGPVNGFGQAPFGGGFSTGGFGQAPFGDGFGSGFTEILQKELLKDTKKK